MQNLGTFDFDIPKENFGIKGLSESKLISELKKINYILETSFSKIKVRQFQKKYYGIGRIHSEVYQLYENLVKIVPEELNKCSGIPLVLYLNNLNQIPEIILKKALVFGETTIIVLPSVSQLNKSNSLYEFYDLPTVLIDFFKKYKEYIEDGFLIPIPYSIFKSVNNNFNIYETSAFTDTAIKNSTIYSIKDKSDLLNLTQTSHHHIFFPSLTNTRLSTIRNLRIKEYSSFRTFHNNLHKLRKEKNFTNERELIDLIKETDYEVRLINSKVKNNNKIRVENLGINAIQGISVTLLTTYENPILKTAAAFLGGATSLQMFQLFNEHRKDSYQLKFENFYFPWKVNKLK